MRKKCKKHHKNNRCLYAQKSGTFLNAMTFNTAPSISKIEAKQGVSQVFVYIAQWKFVSLYLSNTIYSVYASFPRACFVKINAGNIPQ